MCFSLLAWALFRFHSYLLSRHGAAIRDCLRGAMPATVLCIRGMALLSVISNLELSRGSWVFIYFLFSHSGLQTLHQRTTGTHRDVGDQSLCRWRAAYTKVNVVNHNRFYQSLYEVLKINLKSYNAILKRSFRIAKQNYFETCFNKFKSDIKNTWKTINEIICKDKTKKTLSKYFKEAESIIVWYVRVWYGMVWYIYFFIDSTK